MSYFLKCVVCQQIYNLNKIIYRCGCGEILEVNNNGLKKNNQITKKLFEKRLSSFNLPLNSGVWRYKELILNVEDNKIISMPEGNTNLYSVGMNCNNGYCKIGKYANIETLFLKHEGQNPTGSFKDRGMTVGITQAKLLKVKAVACASTGNTSASLASYASLASIPCYVLIPENKISFGKLSQSIAYGAITIQIKGDFDQAMKLIETAAEEFGMYLLNSINPFRIEGQKTIVFELLQQLKWFVPDWIVLPGGNLGNTAALGKGLIELMKLGFIKKLPQIAVIQAQGANPFYQSFLLGFKKKISIKAQTIATAIKIGNPVSYFKAKQIIEKTNGVVEFVNDNEMLDAKAIIDRSGIGCEPASAVTLAGIKKLADKQIIKKNQSVSGILTGHILKDPSTTILYHQNKLPRVKPKFRSKIMVIEPNIKDFKKVFLKD